MGLGGQFPNFSSRRSTLLQSHSSWLSSVQDSEMSYLHVVACTNRQLPLIRSIVEYYNYRCYHEAQGNLSPLDAHTGRHLEVLQCIKGVKSSTVEAGRNYDRTRRGQGFGPSIVRCFQSRNVPPYMLIYPTLSIVSSLFYFEFHFHSQSPTSTNGAQ